MTRATQIAWPATLWTIGHSTRTLDEFIDLLRANRIEVLADVRHFPGSRKQPQFNVEPVRAGLHAAAIDYAPFAELGGRRKPLPDSPNIAWRHPAFRGYADYMATPEFHAGVDHLAALARQKRTAIMCAEAVWWRCHRGLIADLFKLHGTHVLHITGTGTPREHPYTSAARIVDGRLDYTQPPTST